MQRLFPSDCEKLLTLISDLYCTEENDSIQGRLLCGLRPLIPYAYAGCHLIDPVLGRIVPCYQPECSLLPMHHKECRRLARAHPLSRVLFAPPPKAWKLSDTISRRSFHQTEFYEVLYRPLSLDYELVAALPDQEAAGRFLVVSLYRDRSDFSERERTFLNLLLPHIASARQRLSFRERTVADGHWWFCDEKSFYDWICNRTSWELSRRESEVLFWLCQGKSNAEIGSILGIAGRTAETHALRIYPKIGVENRYDAIATLSQLAALKRHSCHPAPGSPAAAV
jgi:DNA-binding CsgD family transcriptional regulator